MDSVRAHPTASLIGLAGILLIILGLLGWYLVRNNAALADLREQAAAIMSPVMLAPADPYDDPDLRPFYGPAELRRREVRLADEQRWERVSPASVIMLRVDTPRQPAPVVEPEHVGADAAWGAELHAIVESDDRGSLLPQGMADPVIEAAYAALSPADIEQAREDADWTAYWRRADRAIAAARRTCTRNVHALLGVELAAEVYASRRRRAKLAAAYASGEHQAPAAASRTRITPAIARRQRKRDNQAKGRAAELVAA